MLVVHFLAINQDEDLILAAAEISESDREEGFYTDAGFIPPYLIFDTESEGLQVLRRIADETGLIVRSALN